MTASREDLVHEALKNLGYLPEGVTPNAEEYAMVDDRVDGVLEELQAREIVYVIDPDQIKDEHLGPLGHILADACKSRFGQLDNTELERLKNQAISDLYVIESLPADGRIVESTYF